MRIAKLAIALFVATLPPSLAFAGEPADPVLASFEQDMNYQASAQSSHQTAPETRDPLVEAIRAALHGQDKPEVRTLSSHAQQTGKGEVYGG
ncbi:MAG: hypothetical protein H6935_04840 [Thiobacillus sp.]|nr:hypothetical protein [Thiobacillus sp.]